jgi:HAD superfamily hydrolase (TIGR01450 family)
VNSPMLEVLNATDPATLLAIARGSGWVLDVDGCLVRTVAAGGFRGTTTPGAPAFLRWLRDHGRKFVVCTNASQRPVREYAAHLRAIGLDIADHEMMTAATAAAAHIAKAHPRTSTLAIGDRGLHDALREQQVDICDATSRSAGVVVVGGADSYATAEINAACIAVADNNAALYVTAEASWFHGGIERAVSASAAIARAIAAITGCRARMCGKPSLSIAQLLCERLKLAGGDIVVVGDSAEAEMKLAHIMGARGVLVFSGATSASDVANLPADQRPHLCADDVGHFQEMLSSTFQRSSS